MINTFQEKSKSEELNLYSNISFFIKNVDAVGFLIVLWRVIQFFDDVYDCDVDQKHIKDNVAKALFDAIIALNDNKFFIENRAVLLPSMSVMILKWTASNVSEENQNVSAQSYMWRAGYYDVVLLVNLLCNGIANTEVNANKILSIYGESFDDYLKEFNKDA